MKTAELSTAIWWRAQGIYILLHAIGVVLAFLASPLLPEDDGTAQFLVLISFFSCGFAIVFGIPGWLLLTLVMGLMARLAARARTLQSLFLIAGLASTAFALWLVFHDATGEFNELKELIPVFCGLALLSMAASVVSLRRSTARLADLLSIPPPNHTPALPDAEA